MNPAVSGIMFIVLPYAISLAFWVSPWVGWPTAVVFGTLWLGAGARVAKS
jgi:hypothetical protein